MCCKPFDLTIVIQSLLYSRIKKACGLVCGHVRFESLYCCFYLFFIVTIVELCAFADQGFGRWPVQYNTREAASAKGDYYLNPFCTHFLLPAKSEKFDGAKLEYDKSISAQTPTVSTAKFRSDLEEYIRRGRFKRNKPGTHGSLPSYFHFLFKFKPRAHAVEVYT